MKPKLILCLALVLSDLQSNCFGATDTTQTRLEQMATNYSHFSLETVIKNRPLRLWGVMAEPQSGASGPVVWKPNPLVEEQTRLVQELRSLDGDRPALAALLKHPDPKVRTLALGALFQREDGRDMPLIVQLVDDPALTFTNLHDSMNQGGGPPPLADVENLLTVGQVAREMLAYWGVPHDGRTARMGYGDGFEAGITANDFTTYWQKYAGRDYSASWLAMRMKRATRDTDPILPEYRADIDRVITDMRALPAPDGLWIQFYVLAPGNQFTTRLVPDDDLIAVAKKLGPDALLRFLQRQPVCVDPDLRLDKDDGLFVGISGFILDHADKLLRPEDCDALLACQYVMHDSGGVNPAWVIGASLVQPARAGALLHDALAHETRNYETAAGSLAGALWRIRGPAELDFLVNWFYAGLPTASEPMHQPVAFLWEVETAARSDTKQLMTALVKDPRFDKTDWDTLKELLVIVNTGRSTPLLQTREIYDAQPNGLLDDRVIFPVWRNLLRREYGLPEEPLPSLQADPKLVLTKPKWSVSQTNTIKQIALSPDGKLLASLSGDRVEIWNAALGKPVWKVRGITTVWVGMQDNGYLIRFDLDEFGALTKWDLATHKMIQRVTLTGKPDSGVTDGVYAFDSAASRFGFSGYNDLVCFDAQNGRASWCDKHEGGVGSVVSLSPDGTLLADGGGYNAQRVAKVFDATNGKLLREFDEHSGKVDALAFSPDDRTLVTATAADGVQLWDVATGKLQRKYSYPIKFMGAGMPPCMPVFSSDGRWLAVAGAWTDTCHFRVGIFRVATGELEWEFRHKKNELDGPPVALAFAPDGSMLYTSGDRIEAWPLK